MLGTSSVRAALHRPLGSSGLLAALGAGTVAAFLALFFSAQAGLLALAAAWLAVLTWRFPWPAFLLLVAAAPFLLILKATVVLGAVTVLKDIVILTLFARAFRERGGGRLGALAVPILFLVAWAGVAFLRADSATIGLLRLRDLLLYVPLAVVAARVVDRPERLGAFLRVFLATAALVLALALVQWLMFPDGMVLRFDPTRQAWIPRAASVLAHPNVLGAYLLFVVPLAGALAFVRPPTVLLSSLSFLMFVAGVVAVTATYSRGAWLALAAVLVTGAVLTAGVRRPRVLVLVGIGAVLLAGVALALPRTGSLLRTAFDPTYASNKTRLEIFAGSLAQLSASGAVGGEGLGDAVTLLGRTADISLYEIAAAGAREAQVAKARTFLDNAVAKTWIEQGVVGVVLAGWVAVRLFLGALRRARNGKSPEQRALGLAGASTLAGLAVLWFFLDVPDVFPANLYFWTFAGLLSTAPAARAPDASASVGS